MCIVIDFSVCGGLIYLWKIEWSDTRGGIHVPEILIRDRIGVSASYLQYARIIKLARESLFAILLRLGREDGERAPEANAPLLAGRQARLIKRQAVPRVTDDVWGGAPVVTRSRIQLPDDLSADSYEVVEIRIIVTLHDALERSTFQANASLFYQKKKDLN